MKMPHICMGREKGEVCGMIMAPHYFPQQS